MSLFPGRTLKPILRCPPSSESVHFSCEVPIVFYDGDEVNSHPPVFLGVFQGRAGVPGLFFAVSDEAGGETFLLCGLGLPTK